MASPFLTAVLTAQLLAIPAASDNANWMANLPQSIASMPLVQLKIPGTHDSFSYSVSHENKVAPGEPGILDKLSKIPFAKLIIEGQVTTGIPVLTSWWSKTQGKDLTGQLNEGIRYLDVRSSYDSTRPNGFYAVHGLYGGNIVNMIRNAMPFFDAHPKEVAIFDFNHYYNFDSDLHAKYMNDLKAVFGTKLCSSDKLSLSSTSLQDIWNSSCQIICVYQGDNAEAPFFGSGAISSPWPDTDKLSALFEQLGIYIDDRSMDSFFVTQALRTEKTDDIIAHLFSTLKNYISEPTTQKAVTWLHGLSVVRKARINIVEADFTSEYSFVDTVIGLNTAGA